MASSGRPGRAGRLGRLAGVLARGALNFVYPPVCLLCGEGAYGESALLCEPCRERLLSGKIEFSFPHAGGRLPAAALGSMEGDPGHLVRELKYRGLTPLARLLGEGMAAVCAKTPVASTGSILIPIPADRVRRRERGFNQAELLARAVSREAGLPLAIDWLRKSRSTLSQTELPAEKRRENVVRSMVVPAGVCPRGSRAILVDDVSTTGATLAEGARSLAEAGAKVEGALVAARATG